jgi:probable HAF family extracellular repeat protein
MQRLPRWNLSGWVIGVFLLGFSKITWAGIIGLGFTSGGSYSQAFDVSNDGSVVVGRSNSQAFRWTEATGMIGLGFLPSGGTESIAIGVSGDGNTVVGRNQNNSAGVHIDAFRWTSPTGMQTLGSLGTRSAAEAWDASFDGSTIVGFTREIALPGFGGPAFRWNALDGIVELGLSQGIARSVSNDGSTIAGQSDGFAFRWTASGGLVNIISGGASAMSADGSYIAGYGIGSTSWVWDAVGGLTNIPLLPTFSDAVPYGVSGDGSLVVGTSVGGDRLEPFIWRRGIGTLNLRDVLVNEYGMSDQLAGWNLGKPVGGQDAQVRGLSTDGNVIVGYGLNPSGQTEAYRISLTSSSAVPEPSILALLCAGIVAVFAINRRRLPMAV